MVRWSCPNTWDGNPSLCPTRHPVDIWNHDLYKQEETGFITLDDIINERWLMPKWNKFGNGFEKIQLWSIVKHSRMGCFHLRIELKYHLVPSSNTSLWRSFIHIIWAVIQSIFKFTDAFPKIAKERKLKISKTYGRASCMPEKKIMRLAQQPFYNHSIFHRNTKFGKISHEFYKWVASFNWKKHYNGGCQQA